MVGKGRSREREMTEGKEEKISGRERQGKENRGKKTPKI